MNRRVDSEKKISSIQYFIGHLCHGCEDVTVLSLLQTLQRALQEQAVPAPSSACGGDEATSVLYDILGE